MDFSFIFMPGNVRNLQMTAILLTTRVADVFKCTLRDHLRVEIEML